MTDCIDPLKVAHARQAWIYRRTFMDTKFPKSDLEQSADHEIKVWETMWQDDFERFIASLPKRT